MQRIRKEIQQILDNDILTASHDKKSVFYELRDSPSLPMAEKSVQRLEDEGTLLVMAGSCSVLFCIQLLDTMFSLSCSANEYPRH